MSRSKVGDILESARKIAPSVESWAELSNALFDAEKGLLAKAFRTREERAALVKSPEYREIRRLIDEAAGRTGLVEGASSNKSGRFVVRLPRSLHAALEREAKEEGVSLNQLVVTKLAVQLHTLAQSSS